MIIQLIFVSAIGLSVLDVSSAQGEGCYTPNNYYGVCVVLPQCPSLVEYYGSSPNSRFVYNFLIGSQRSCGTRSINRNPLVCCTDPVSYTQAPTRPVQPVTPEPIPPDVFTEPQPVTPEPIPPNVFTEPQPVTPYRTTTPPPTTPQPTVGPTSARLDQGCYDPNNVPGVCRSIKECPSILNEFLARQKDQAYIQYIRNSNAKCNYIQPNICCPDSSDQGTTRVPSPATRSPNPSSDITPRLLTVEEGCGFSNATHKRIVGGDPAKPGAWPWMALLGYTNNLGVLSWKCGGSLITTRHILTAAHCIKSTLTTVRLGEHDLSRENDGAVQDIPVIKVAKYPQYDMKDGNSDLAIVYLASDAELSLRVTPICLLLDEPQRSQSYVGHKPFVAGWGRLSEGGKTSNILQELQLPVLDTEVCKDRYRKQGKLNSEKQFNSAVLCAGVLTGGQDSCQGDSGGPLMTASIINGQSIYYQIGIVSYGIGCARTDVPGVYTRVPNFIDWIEEKVAEPV